MRLESTDELFASEGCRGISHERDRPLPSHTERDRTASAETRYFSSKLVDILKNERNECIFIFKCHESREVVNRFDSNKSDVSRKQVVHNREVGTEPTDYSLELLSRKMNIKLIINNAILKDLTLD